MPSAACSLSPKYCSAARTPAAACRHPIPVSAVPIRSRQLPVAASSSSLPNAWPFAPSKLIITTRASTTARTTAKIICGLARGSCFVSARGKPRRISPDVLESQRLEKRQQDILAPAAIEYVFRRLEIQLAKHVIRIESNLETARGRKAHLEASLENLTRWLPGGRV